MKMKQPKRKDPQSTTVVSKNEGKSVAADAIIPHEQAMIGLNENLQARDLAPAETAKDGNCFLGQCPK